MVKGGLVMQLISWFPSSGTLTEVSGGYQGLPT